MLFLISLLIAAGFAAWINALFGFSGRVAGWLRLFLLVWGHIILAAQVSGALSILTPAGFIATQAIQLLAAVWLYNRFKRPPILFPYTRGESWMPPARLPLAVAILGIGAGLVYTFNAILSLFVPQNNYDSLTYHLARVGFWIQHHSLAFWETPNFRQTSFPPNAELGILWSVLLSGSDRLSGLFQWGAALACMLSIFGIARLLRATISQAALAALLWAALPQVLLQSTTTQNDLVIAAFLLCTVYFLHSGAVHKRLSDLVFSGAALGLALGTKTTLFFALPGLGIAVLIWMLPNLRKTARGFAAWAGFCLVGFALLGGMVYMQNWLAYQHPLGPAAEGEGSGPAVSRFTRLGQNSLIYSYQFLDFTGLPEPAAAKLTALKAQATAKVLRKLNWDFSVSVYSSQQILNLPARTHEDLAWFGPVLWLGFLPAWVVAIWSGVKNRRPDLLAYALMGLCFLATLSFLIGWTPFKSRYFIPCAALVAPLFFLIDRPRLRFYSGGLALLSVVILAYTMLSNESRPLTGAGAIWGTDELTLRTRNMPNMKAVVEAADAFVPLDSRLALRLGENGADYLFFGTGFRRELVQVDPLIQREGITGLKAVDADYLLVGPRQQFFFTPPPGLEQVAQANNAVLYRIDNQRLSAQMPQRSEPFPESDPQRLVFVDPELNLRVAVMEIWTGAWGIEQLDGNGFYWFGQGEPQGLGMKIWSEVEMDALLRIQIAPGPSRQDPARTLVVVPSLQGKRQPAQLFPFTAPGELRIPIHLVQGVNEIGFNVREAADGSILPNGDPRALLARLDRMTIAPRP